MKQWWNDDYHGKIKETQREEELASLPFDHHGSLIKSVLSSTPQDSAHIS
jgi:hypothetical protein